MVCCLMLCYALVCYTTWSSTGLCYFLLDSSLFYSNPGEAQAWGLGFFEWVLLVFFKCSSRVRKVFYTNGFFEPRLRVLQGRVL